MKRRPEKGRALLSTGGGLRYPRETCMPAANYETGDHGKTCMFFNCKGSEPKHVLTYREVRSCRRRAKNTWLYAPGAAGEELGAS